MPRPIGPGGFAFVRISFSMLTVDAPFAAATDLDKQAPAPYTLASVCEFNLVVTLGDVTETYSRLTIEKVPGHFVQDAVNGSSLITILGIPATTDPLMFPSGDDGLQYVELHNRGPGAVNLGGWELKDGISFTFTNGSRLAPGAFWVLARDGAAFAARYPGVQVNGVYSGKLDNAGEKLTLAHTLGTSVFSFSYNS